MILIAVPLFFQLAFIGLVARMRREGAEAQRWTIHTKDVIAQAQRCRIKLLASHGAIQGYILTRDASYEAALRQSAASTPAEFEKLRGEVGDNPSQTAAAARIGDASTRFLGFMEEGRSMVQGGRMDAASAASRRRQSQEMLGSLDADFDHFLDEERRLDAQRNARLRESWATFDRLLFGGGVASVLCTVVVAVIFAKNISGRIAGLTENTRRLAEGRELAPPMGGGDEIGRLDRVFHEMASTLDDAARREKLHAEQIERRAEELADVNAQLRDKAQENEMFVYSVSHDLRSPLVNLQGFSKELGLLGKDLSRLIDQDGVPDHVRRGAKALIEAEMGESIGFIQTAVTRLSGIIDALLRLSRAGRVEYRHQQVDVAGVVDRVVGALRGTIDQRRAEVAVGELPTAWGDPTAVEQVFANLIGNAINYLDPARPGRIEVEAVDPAGLPEGTPANGLVFYRVSDNGLGISDSYKSKVFTAFQRLHGDVAKGEGIGLTLVRRMVERHGGRVWFESEPGRGTTFFVSLPSAEVPDAEVDDPPPAATESAGQSERDVAWQPSR